MNWLQAIGDWFVRQWETFYFVMLENDRWLLLLTGLQKTLIIAICAIIIGTLIGCILALCKISQSKLLRGLAQVYITVIRGIPLATQLMIFSFVVFAPLHWDKTVIAILGFGFNSGAYVAEIIRAGIQGVDKGQMEAGRSLGLSKAQTMIHIVIPQAVKAILPTYTNEFVVLIKETSVASFIAVTDLNKAGDMIRNATFNAWIPLITVAAMYLVLTLGLSTLFSMLERRLKRSDRG